MELTNFKKLLTVIDRLRDPKHGCPWDLKQTHESLTRYLLEECYEFREAVTLNDSKKMEEEIGDVLLQVLLHTKIASEDEKFDLESCAQQLASKLIRRHPHVFNNQDGIQITKEEVLKNWESIKMDEHRKEHKYEIDERYTIFPALQSSWKIGEKSSRINFDWKSPREVMAKVEEELDELKDAIKQGTSNEHIEEELGDLLFTVAQLARHLGLMPEETLQKANMKFIKRFKKMEDLMSKEKVSFKTSSQEELEKYWHKSKKALKNET